MSIKSNIKNILLLDSEQKDVVQTQLILKENFDFVLIRAFFRGKDLLEFLQFKGTQEADFPDLLILEIDFPDEDGVETLRTLRRLTAFNTVPVILHTRTWNFDLIEKGFKYGARAIVPKFSAVQLKAQICRILSELQAA